MATGFGLQFSRTLSGRAPVTRRYYIPSTDSGVYCKGDVVKLVATTGVMDPKGEVPQVVMAATGEILLGVIQGFREDSSALVTGHVRAASTNRYVDVIVDPEAVYQAQEDAVGGSITQALIGAMTNCALVVAAGTATTGVSGTMIDSSQTTASAADVKIVGVVGDGGNNVGAKSGGAILECMILAPAIKATDSQS